MQLGVHERDPTDQTITIFACVLDGQVP